MPYGNSWLECDWKAHPFHTDIVVSNNGRVLSYKSGSWRELRPGLSGRGYLTICIGHDKTVPVHRLVAQTFVLNPYNKPYVNHKDGDKTNNNASNLEWVTASENEHHAYANGLKHPHHKGRKIRIVDTGEIFDSIAGCATHVGGHGPGISRCLSGACKTHRGFRYEYVEEAKHG